MGGGKGFGLDPPGQAKPGKKGAGFLGGSLLVDGLPDDWDTSEAERKKKLEKKEEQRSIFGLPLEKPKPNKGFAGDPKHLPIPTGEEDSEPVADIGHSENYIEPALMLMNKDGGPASPDPGASGKGITKPSRPSPSKGKSPARPGVGKDSGEGRADFSGLFDSGKRGGADSTPESPSPAPEAVFGSKEFYKWRAEDFERRHPGKQPPAYYMEYGDKYARIFSGEVRDGLSDKGKKWVDSTRRILQQKIEEKIASGEMNELDPEAFEQQAFEMHSDAYLEGGINNLPGTDIIQIMGAVEGEDWVNPRSWGEMLEVAFPLD